MPKKSKVRVVSANTKTASVQKAAPRVVVSNTSPKPTQLTTNEIKARKIRKYATTTTTGSSFGSRTADVMDSIGGAFYSPQLSTDFLEKPQNLRERRAFYRFFYNTNEYIGAAIDVHSSLPLSKIRLVAPKTQNKELGDYAFKFFESMCEEMKLFKTLIEITHEYYLFGNAFCFAEEYDPYEGLPKEEIDKKREESKQRSEYLHEKFEITDNDPFFKGWKKILILPPDQVRVRKIPLSDDVAIEFVPDPETKRLLSAEAPMFQDPYNDALMNYEIPADMKEKLRTSGSIPLDTNPYSGSHVYHLARKKSQYEPLGISIIERCINTLVLLDKLRQAQTSIASRHMTPMRIVWAEDLSDGDVDNLREQVDLALVDPDYSIVANYEVHWEEMGSNGRILDLSAENEYGENRLFAGMHVTREVLTGEGTYSGTRIGLEIMNTMYLQYRELIQEYVENNLFKPIAKKKGFIEIDKYGNENLIYPRLSFTRLAIRDNEQYFDAAFQLYQKGSISIDLILDILNIDPDATKEKIEADLFTVNDSQFNEMIRNVYTNVAGPMTDNTNIVEKLADYLNLNMKPAETPAPGAQRFSSDQKKNGNLDKDQALKLSKVIKHLTENPEALERIFRNGSNSSPQRRLTASKEVE